MLVDMRRWTVMKKGGHFAAMEQPEALADDIQCSFAPYGNELRTSVAPLSQQIVHPNCQIQQHSRLVGIQVQTGDSFDLAQPIGDSLLV